MPNYEAVESVQRAREKDAQCEAVAKAEEEFETRLRAQHDEIDRVVERLTELKESNCARQDEIVALRDGVSTPHKLYTIAFHRTHANIPSPLKSSSTPPPSSKLAQLSSKAETFSCSLIYRCFSCLPVSSPRSLAWKPYLPRPWI